MWLTSVFDSLKSRLSQRPARQGGGARRRPLTCRLQLEALEDRFLPSGYVQTNLASDQPGVARIHDPDLVDGWGLALNETPTATFWVSARATGVSTVYTGDRPRPDGTLSPFVKSALTVTIPGGEPTGQVFSGSNTDFIVRSGSASAPSRFITVSNTGHLTGWNPTVRNPDVAPPASCTAAISCTAVLTATTPDAIYTGLAIGNNGAGNFLYAADFLNGRIDVFDRTFTATTLAGDFTDPTMDDDYAPFNIQCLGGTDFRCLGGKLYVTYAKQHDDGIPHGGKGFVSVFDMNGNFLNRLISEGDLKAPWGLVLTPGSFGEFSNALLVGNFHGGRIGAYNPATGAFLGELRDPDGQRIKIDGLWGLAFGNAFTGDPKALYFTAGPDHQRHGLFGSLRVAVGAPAASALFSFGPDVLGGLGEDNPEPTADGHPVTGGHRAERPRGDGPADHSSLLGSVDVPSSAADEGDSRARLFALDPSLDETDLWV